MSNYLAIDLGAESGRGVLGALKDGILQLEEIHRFNNQPVSLPGGLHWNAASLFQETLQSIVLGSSRVDRLNGVGVDTWGVDYALIDSAGTLLGLPYHYRDHRTDGEMARVFARVPRETIFARTGLQFMQLNTLFQLTAEKERDAPALSGASQLLFMPDLLHFWLSGEKVCEYTVATTSQLYNPTLHAQSPGNGWDRELLEMLGLPASIFKPTTQPGTTVGCLRQALQQQLGVAAIDIIAPASHDTASAVAAVPAEDADFAYISSGTWSLIGVENREPCLSPAALEANFTNEGGVGGTYRFLKNIMGLWLVQECRRSWARQGQDVGYSQLAILAGSSPGFGCFIDPDEPSFLAPDDMPAAIRAYCARTGQQPPEEPGEMVRACLEGLAFKYRESVNRLESITSRRLKTLHIVGGGSQNRLLCQFAADATGRRVVAGPVEATAAGNILVQAIGRGDLGSLADIRAVVRKSFSVEEYLPVDQQKWTDASARFDKITRAANAESYPPATAV